MKGSVPLALFVFCSGVLSSFDICGIEKVTDSEAPFLFVVFTLIPCDNNAPLSIWRYYGSQQ